MAPTGGFGGWFGLWRACPSGCHMGACLSSPPAEVGFGDISTTPSKHFDTAVELDGMVEVPPQVGLAKEPPRPCALPPGRVPRQRRGCVTHTHTYKHTRTQCICLCCSCVRAGWLAGVRAFWIGAVREKDAAPRRGAARRARRRSRAPSASSGSWGVAWRLCGAGSRASRLLRRWLY